MFSSSPSWWLFHVNARKDRWFCLVVVEMEVVLVVVEWGLCCCVTCFKVCTPAIKLPMDASDRAGSSQDKAMPPHAY